MATSSLSTVKVTFEGLMVFHPLKDRPGGLLEVGILKGVPEHYLQIEVSDSAGDPMVSLGQAQIDNFILSYGRAWTVEVRNSVSHLPRLGVTQHNQGHTNRLDTDPDHQADFSWIIDMESLHGEYLPLFSDMLAPILMLEAGELSTVCKTFSLDLGRRVPVPSQNFNLFGYVAEQVALTIDLNPGDEFIVKIENTIPEQPVVGPLLYRPGVDYTVSFQNIMDHRGNPSPAASHLQLYYLLFRNVPPSERFDLRLTQGTPPPPPDLCVQHGDSLQANLLTVNPFMCGAVLLSMRSILLSNADG